MLHARLVIGTCMKLDHSSGVMVFDDPLLHLATNLKQMIGFKKSEIDELQTYARNKLKQLN